MTPERQREVERYMRWNDPSRWEVNQREAMEKGEGALLVELIDAIRELVDELKSQRQ